MFVFLTACAKVSSDAADALMASAAASSAVFALLSRSADVDWATLSSMYATNSGLLSTLVNATVLSTGADVDWATLSATNVTHWASADGDWVNVAGMGGNEGNAMDGS
jgi:hypothetical protein